MNDTICIDLDHAEGSLPRLIGLIERRGFIIDGLEMRVGPEGRRLTVTLRPRDATRCIDVLGRQIDRLYGMCRTPVLSKAIA